MIALRILSRLPIALVKLVVRIAIAWVKFLVRFAAAVATFDFSPFKIAQLITDAVGESLDALGGLVVDIFREGQN